MLPIYANLFVVCTDGNAVQIIFKNQPTKDEEPQPVAHVAMTAQNMRELVQAYLELERKAAG